LNTFVDGGWPLESDKVTKTSVHLQMRFHYSGVPLRPFLTDDYFWFWEAYGLLRTVTTPPSGSLT